MVRFTAAGSRPSKPDGQAHGGVGPAYPFFLSHPHESTEADYDRLMDINVRSAFLVCRRAVKEMSDHGGGSIVITASIASELGYSLESLYCMTKGAVLQLARSILLIASKRIRLPSHAARSRVTLWFPSI